MVTKAEEETLSLFLHDLCAGLEAVATANADLMLPSGADKEMKKLSKSVHEFGALVNAKARDQWKGGTQAWLREVEDTAYEINGILQIFSPRSGRNKISAPKSSISSEAGHLQDRRASPELVQELKAIRTRLDKILKKQNLQRHHPSSHLSTIKKMAISHCPIEPITLSGKDEDCKDMIVALLLSAKESEQGAGPFIIPIDKRGGGSTELARAIFEDKRVVNHFDRAVWMTAKEFIDPGKLTRFITKPASTLFWVHKTLNVKLMEEQVLLVLDDVRNKTIFRNDISSEQKAPFMFSLSYKNNHPHYWRRKPHPPPSVRLSAEDSWKLFEIWALRRARGHERQQLEGIGRDIVMKRGGSRSITSEFCYFLAGKREPSHWKLVLQSRFWELPVVEEVALLPKIAELCCSASLLGKYYSFPHCPHFMARFHRSKSRRWEWSRQRSVCELCVAGSSSGEKLCKKSEE